MAAIFAWLLITSLILPQSINVNFKHLPEWVNTKFYPLFFNKTRRIFSYGGAGSGKSYSQAQKVVYKTVAEKGHNFLVVRKVAKTNRVSTFPLILSVINQWGLGQLFRYNKTDMSITCWPNGNQIIFAGLDDVEKLKSITFVNGILTDIWVEEITECTAKEVSQLNLRLRGLAPVPFQLTGTFNPVSELHWIKAKYFDISYLNTYTIKTTYINNRYLDADYRMELQALKDTDPTFYQIYCLGDWGVYGDLVFHNYEIKSFDKNMEFDEIIYGMDFGYNHRYAIVKIGIKDDILYFLDEIYVKEHTTKDVIELNKELNVLPKTGVCIADSADPASIKLWCDAGYDVTGAKKGPGSRTAGYSYLKTRKMIIHPSCVGMASEVQMLQNKTDADGNKTDEPIEIKDDAIAAARYATEPLWNTGGSAFAIITDIGV